MADLERTYVIPLRREFLKVPKYRRAKKAVKAVKEFLIRHMKAKEVKLHKELNEELLKHGRQNPPHKIKIKAAKYGDVVRTNLEGFSVEEPKKKEEKIKEEKKEVKGEVKEELTKVEEQKKKEEEEKRKILHKKQA
ncbi:MAG: 50S ribosomal protein L31e [Nanoarchaeota archaeon]